MENKIHVGNHQPDDVSNDLPEMSGSITHTHHIPKVLPRRPRLFEVCPADLKPDQVMRGPWRF